MTMSPALVPKIMRRHLVTFSTYLYQIKDSSNMSLSLFLSFFLSFLLSLLSFSLSLTPFLYEICRSSPRSSYRPISSSFSLFLPPTFCTIPLFLFVCLSECLSPSVSLFLTRLLLVTLALALLQSKNHITRSQFACKYLTSADSL